jgi:hypothetical protein
MPFAFDQDASVRYLRRPATTEKRVSEPRTFPPRSRDTRLTHSATLASPLKCAHSDAAIVSSAMMKVDVMSHHRFFGPTLSPIRPREDPRRNEMSEVRACWSPLWKVRSDVANNRAMARLSWTRLPAAELRGAVSKGRGGLNARDTHFGNRPRCSMPRTSGQR